MITEIIYYNSGWLATIILAGILSGIIWAWRPKIAVIIFGMAIGMFIWTGWRILTDGIVAFADAPPLYYYIGSCLGGAGWNTWFRIGKDVYAKSVMK